MFRTSYYTVRAGMPKYLSTTNNPLVNNGKNIFFNKLTKNGVTDAFVYSGGAVMPLIDSFYKNGKINTFVNTNELCTGMSAIGYAKSSNKTGVCVVTSGPGITNMITPLLDAKNDSTPLIVFSGQVPLAAEGTNAFQEAPAVELTKNVTKWSYKLTDINDMGNVIDEAFRVANEGKKGSVHIDIPKCVSYQELNSNSYFNKDNYRAPRVKPTEKIDLNKFKQVANIINNSKNPIIYLGKGCSAYSKELTKFAKLSNIPVTSTIHGVGIFDEHEDLSLRWCGMHGYAPANFALQKADTIIAIGSRFDDRTTGNINEYAPNAFKAGKEKKGGIIHINLNKEELNFVVDSHYNFHMDSGVFLNHITPFIQYKKRQPWIQCISNMKTKYPFKLKKSDYNKKNQQVKTYSLHMEEVLDTIYKKTLDKDIIFTTGVGNHQMQAYQFIKSQYPNKIISSGSLGVMGAGLPYSIGAQIANPDKMIMNIDGDSSFNMTLSDLKTIKENNLPVKIAIMNNNAQMMVTIWEKLFFNERYTATLNECNPSYTDLANSFGIKSIKCNNKNSLNSVVDYFINHKGPILCEFDIKKDICLPLVGPGKALDDMILHETFHNNIQMNGMAPN
jgi:acetolactate synthase I/II/III large subunit